jgi:hypothetical protein
MCRLDCTNYLAQFVFHNLLLVFMSTGVAAAMWHWQVMIPGILNGTLKAMSLDNLF